MSAVPCQPVSCQPVSPQGEEGNATGTGEAWTYTATTTLPARTPVTIEVTAKDATEHEGKDTRNYP